MTTYVTWFDQEESQIKAIRSQLFEHLDTLGGSSSLVAGLASSGLTMTTSNLTCMANCSGRGECLDGVCFCKVEYSGGACDNPNLRFYIAFSTVFYAICVITFIQLILCINSEYSRQKPRSLLRAFRITTQKAMYFFICVATGLRGFYFSSSFEASGHVTSLKWSASLMSAYYPVLMSCSSLMVCFWAETFHLHDVSPERPGFLSKSFTGFILFNVVTYSLLSAELILLQFADTTETERSLFFSVFNGIYAFLMLIVVVFFLIYGVEVYFKVRGAFIQGENCSANVSQLNQSRVGLVSQAVLLLVTILFIVSDVLGSYWKDKVPVLSRNTHEVMFRVVELGVALWFPCVLWNCMKPEALWVLNPRRILKRVRECGQGTAGQSGCPGGPDAEPTAGCSRELEALVDPNASGVAAGRDDGTASRIVTECFICYDSERSDMGALIHPCACKGDVAAVHHDCLKQWLMESYSNPDEVRCKVCDEQYSVQRGEVWLPSGLTTVHWVQTACTLSVMCSAAGSVFLMVRLFDHVAVRTISVGLAFIIEYICLRILGVNLLSAYNRAKFSAIKIGGQRLVANKAASSQKVIVRNKSPTRTLCVSMIADQAQVTMVTVSGSIGQEDDICAPSCSSSAKSETSFSTTTSSEIEDVSEQSEIVIHQENSC